MADGDATRWSRNLSEVNQSERNRQKLIERQKQILNSKRQREPQIIATSGPAVIRPTKSAHHLVSSRSSDRLLADDPSENESLSRGSSSGVINRGLNITGEADYDGNESSGGVGGLNALIESYSNKSPPSTSRVLVSSSSSGGAENKKKGGKETQRDVLVSVDSDSSQDEDHEENESPADHSGGEERTNSSHHRHNNNTSSPRVASSHSDGSTSLVLNPLTSILSNFELLEFATGPISPHQTFQCTIIRDKRGIDRSLYPTYYMYLQAIIPRDVDDESSSIRSPDSEKEDVMMKSGGEATEKVLKNFPKLGLGSSSSSACVSPSNSASDAGNRQVFLLCGRRRKKSKTYLIGSDPFDISRVNCVAKLKSNVIGTQFRAIKMNRGGERAEVATVIYDANVLGFKGPRKMTILIPGPSEAPMESLIDGWKRRRCIRQLKNKTPVWNEDSQSYVLNFHGRVTQASVKNFQLVEANSQEFATLDDHSSSPSHAWDPSSSPSAPPSSASSSALKSGQFDHYSERIPSKNEYAPTLPTTSPSASGAKSSSTSSGMMQQMMSNQGTGGTSPNSMMAMQQQQQQMIMMTGGLDPEVTMQFGRVSDKEFTCDVTHPLSPLQAFAIALSSFDSKLACE